MKTFLYRLTRTVLLIVFVAAGTLTLVRFAPGCFSDAREMDAQYAGNVRAELESCRIAERSASATAFAIASSWLHGDFGISRQGRTPVSDLIVPRLLVTVRMLGGALAVGWLAAILSALLLSLPGEPRGKLWVAFGSAIMLSVPIGALATVFLLTDTGAGACPWSAAGST